MKVDDWIVHLTIVKVSSLNPFVHININAVTRGHNLLGRRARDSIRLVSCLMGMFHAILLEVEGELFVDILSSLTCAWSLIVSLSCWRVRCACPRVRRVGRPATGAVAVGHFGVSSPRSV